MLQKPNFSTNDKIQLVEGVDTEGGTRIFSGTIATILCAWDVEK